jgi:hypothetical protein
MAVVAVVKTVPQTLVVVAVETLAQLVAAALELSF